LGCCPAASTFVVFGSRNTGAGVEERGKEERALVLADPDDFEESLCAESVTVVADARGGGLLRIEKGGGGYLGIESMRKVVAMAEERAIEWGQLLGP
jgi:exosome complex component RRP43